MATALPQILLGHHNLRLTVASGDALDVRRFKIHEGMNALFSLVIEAVSSNADVDFSAVAGQPASFQLSSGNLLSAPRAWDGLVSHIDQVGVDREHLSTYEVHLVPSMWLLTQRRNYRVFQQVSDLDVALQVLGDWGIQPRLELAPSDYKARRYRVQYAESDYTFVCRLLEDSGIAFYFEQGDDGTRLVLSERPNRNDPRASIPYLNAPNPGLSQEFATRVRVGRKVRPGRYTQGDVDYRRPPEFPLVASANGGEGIEGRLERYHHNYGAFVYRAEGGGDTPAADDHGAARSDLGEGQKQAQKRLDAKRGPARGCSFETTAHDLAPGTVVAFSGHPRHDLDRAPLLIVKSELEGTPNGAWAHRCEARFADQDYRPPLVTPKPRTHGVESATVVGRDAEDIHTDEYGRIRVQFHWDREGKRDENASCWIPVSQPWGGSSFGAVNLPRIGQEVLVDFLGADPDRPVVVGRVYTQTQPVPYKLPKYKNISGIRSETTPRLVMGAADGSGAADAVTSLLGGGTPLSSSDIDAIARGDTAFRPSSPNGDTHTFPGSEITFDDTAQREIAYLQAQRDLNILVKNAMTTLVGNHRATRIGTDDLLSVGNKQTIGVGSDRTVVVAGQQAHTVTGDVFQTGEANQTFKTTETYKSTAKEHLIASETRIVLQVGTSLIIMQPNFIVIQADDVFINPGPESTTQAAEGQRPEKPEERAAREAAAAHQAALARMNTVYAEQLQMGPPHLAPLRTIGQMRSEGYSLEALHGVVNDPSYAGFAQSTTWRTGGSF